MDKLNSEHHVELVKLGFVLPEEIVSSSSPGLIKSVPASLELERLGWDEHLVQAIAVDGDSLSEGSPIDTCLSQGENAQAVNKKCVKCVNFAEPLVTLLVTFE
eukprot:3779286-Amphidinium_carterae.1